VAQSVEGCLGELQKISVSSKTSRGLYKVDFLSKICEKTDRDGQRTLGGLSRTLRTALYTPCRIVSAQSQWIVYVSLQAVRHAYRHTCMCTRVCAHMHMRTHTGERGVWGKTKIQGACT
jgi:hypothetical protein